MKDQKLRSILSLTGLTVLGFQIGWWFPPMKATAGQDEVTELLDAIEFIGLPDGAGNNPRTLRISGVNLQVVSGQGATNGNPADPTSTDAADVQTNGTGNLIIGYLEEPSAGTGLRTGSHNVLVGSGHSYTSFASFVSGSENIAGAPFAALVAGRSNEVSGVYAATVGGRDNRATQDYAVAAGGRDNEASGLHSIALGGGGAVIGNTASGDSAVVVGGRDGSAEADASVVVGGADNRSSAESALVAGGESNHASGTASALLGGQGRSLTVDHGVLADSGGVDDDWSVDVVDGVAVLSANAGRVGIGESEPSAPLEVEAPSDEEVAASFQGDLLVGRIESDPKLDPTEHIELRGSLSRWYLGVENADAKEDAGFFVSTDPGAREMFHLSPTGNLGLGTEGPAAALHVAREGAVEVLLEGGDPGAGEATGIRMRNTVAEGVLGFFGNSSELVFGYPPDDGGPRVELNGEQVTVKGILDVQGPALFQDSLTAEGSLGVGANLVVQGDAEVQGDLIVHGQLQMQGPSPGWELLRPLAFGRVAQTGARISGSQNWTCTYRAMTDDFLITVNPAPTGATLLLAHHATGGTVATGIEHPSDPNSQLADNEFIVRLVKGWAGLPGNAFPFQFVLLEMLP